MIWNGYNPTRERHNLMSLLQSEPHTLQPYPSGRAKNSNFHRRSSLQAATSVEAPDHTRIIIDDSSPLYSMT
ncbi:hypothetical protein COMA1_30455 [Candidatus Nitrospira nitrosa]|uniref:Uncharacterized protein n=1 Tax=Candidatus Nitrospira nitrosa TaxID=1742972 RepID=A0A0S4LKZ4_9BACT|nr:hypothetical protein COMA1_30455 [Candidatus Nitrospira nitrosa]